MKISSLHRHAELVSASYLALALKSKTLNQFQGDVWIIVKGRF
jgi:hypothetical protein